MKTSPLTRGEETDKVRGSLFDISSKNKRTTFCAVVPAFNEECVIGSSLESLKQAVPEEDIYVVSDGSSDNTASIARGIVPNVFALIKNRGKAGALHALMEKYQLTDRYDYIFFFDADTKVKPDLLKEVRKYTKARPACIVGTVTSQRKKLVSAYRVYEYGFYQRFYKTAQSCMGAITVAPGCISFYRADVMKQLDFSNKTLTEDYDLTIQIHKKKLGKIIYAPKAKVITQDPPTIRDYLKQMNRWYTGYWQNMFLHKLYIPKDKLNLEVLLLTADTVAWTISLIIAITHPLIMLRMFLYAVAAIWLIALIVMMSEKQYWAIKYIPLFGIFQFLNLCMFAFTFFRALFLGTKNLSWQKVSRYANA